MKVRKKTWVAGGKTNYGWVMDSRHPITKVRSKPIIRDPETGLPVKSKAEAEMIAAAIWVDINAKAKDPKAQSEANLYLTLEDLFEAHRERAGKSEWTIQIEEKQAKNILRLMPGKLVTEIDSRSLEQYVKDRKAEKDRKRPAKPPTILKELKLIRQAVRWGAEQGMCKDPAFRLPKLSPVKPKPRSIDAPDIQSLFESCGDDTSYLRQVTEVMYYTGLRRMELFTLKWENVDFKNRRLVFVTKKGGMADDRNEDVVYLSERPLKLLKERRKACPTGYVFGVETGLLRNKKPTHEPFDYRVALQKVAKVVGLDGVTVHTMRHSCATNLFEAGAVVPEIASHLRHRDGGRLLLERYAHSYEKNLRAAADNLERLNLGPKTVPREEKDTDQDKENQQSETA